MKKRDNSKLRFFFAVAFTLLWAGASQASTIDPGNDGSRHAWAENGGWLSFASAFGPGVTVTDTAVTGFAWAENTGWINLSPAGFGGVTNDGAGKLSGFAWGENVGWVSFSCANNSVCGTSNYGVIIDESGHFTGYAWSETIGWINFSLVSMPSLRVQTSWEIAASTTTSSVGGGTPATTTVSSTTTTAAGGTTTTVSSTTTTAAGQTTTTVSFTTTTAAGETTTTIPGSCPAAMVLGEDNPDLENLRAFRDSTLAQSTVGRRVIEIYYNNAESINAALDRSTALKAVARSMLEAITSLLGE